jgi:methyl-accepting chemotaxis protein
MFKNTNLTTKIVLAMCVTILGMSIIAGSSYIGLSKIGSEIEEIAGYQIPLNTLITELEKDILEEEILTYQLIIESKNINSKKFKDIEHHILELEKQTDKTIKEAEHLAQKAIDHNTDEKTKGTYKLFLEELHEIEKEQKEFKHTLSEFEEHLKHGSDEKKLEKDKEHLEKELSLMDKNIQKLIHQMEELLEHSTHQAEKDEKLALLVIEIISAVVLLISILIAYLLTKSVKSSIREFQAGLIGFFKYLNKETSSVELLKANSTDEIGTMSKVINENIEKSQNALEEERKIIDDTVNVLTEFEVGNLSTRVVKTCSNESLNELTKLLNHMGDNLENNIDGILVVLDKYSNNDFTSEVSTKGIKGHLLKLSKGINLLHDTITQSLVINQNNGITLNNSADTLSRNVQNLSESSTEAAASLEETSAALEEITSTIISNSDNISKMTKYASEVTNSADSGEKLAKDTMNSMDEINEQVISINEAITIIDQIAFQTNILSLNAAVEAATAGEAGKGFAVVAAEVRNLAARSAEAAKEIKDIVETATIKAQEGKNITKNMLDGYEGLNKGITDTLSLIKDVESASKEQQTGIEQINDAISQLDQQTQQNSNIASETNDIVINTKELSEKIIEDVNSKNFDGKNKDLTNQISSTQTKVEKIHTIDNKPKSNTKTVNNQAQKIVEQKDDDSWESF